MQVTHARRELEQRLADDRRISSSSSIRRHGDRSSDSDERNASGSDGDSFSSSCSMPTMICESISRESFRCWLEVHDGELRRWQYESLTSETGRVVPNLPTQIRAPGVVKAVIRSMHSCFQDDGGAMLKKRHIVIISSVLTNVLSCALYSHERKKSVA